MFWWIFGGALALFAAPVAIVMAAAIVDRSRHTYVPSSSRDDRPREVHVTVEQHVHVHSPAGSRRRRGILRSVEASQEKQRRARRASLDRRYYRDIPW